MTQPLDYPSPFPAIPADTLAVPSPLDETHFAIIRRAAVERRAVDRAARTARLSAVSTLAIAVLSVAVALLFTSWQAFVIAAALLGIGLAEWIGYQRLRRAEPAAARWLATNQLVFLAVICLYCLVQMATFSPKQLKSQMQGMEQDLSPMLDMVGPSIVYGFYSLVILASVAMQGGLALYYFTRKKCLQQFRQATPAWVQRLFVEIGA